MDRNRQGQEVLRTTPHSTESSQQTDQDSEVRTKAGEVWIRLEQQNLAYRPSLKAPDAWVEELDGYHTIVLKEALDRVRRSAKPGVRQPWPSLGEFTAHCDGYVKELRERAAANEEQRRLTRYKPCDPAKRVERVEQMNALIAQFKRGHAMEGEQFLAANNEQVSGKQDAVKAHAEEKDWWESRGFDASGMRGKQHKIVSGEDSK